jgi:hypothetical protein
MMRALIMCLLALIAAACTTTKEIYVPVETVRTDSVYTVKFSVDTLIQRDSVYHYVKGDTVLIERYHTRYKSTLKTDTLYIERIDTISVPYPIESKLTKWQSIKQDVGGISIGVVFVAVIALIVWLAIRRRNRS